MTGDVLRPESVLRQDAEGGYRYGKQRGLRIFGELEGAFGTVEAELGEGKSKRVIGLREGVFRHWEILGEAFPHTRELRSLPGKQEGCLHAVKRKSKDNADGWGAGASGRGWTLLGNRFLPVAARNAAVAGLKEGLFIFFTKTTNRLALGLRLKYRVRRGSDESSSQPKRY